MNTIGDIAKFVIQNPDKKKKNDKNKTKSESTSISIGTSKKTKCNFKSAQYFSMLYQAKSVTEVNSVIERLKREAINAVNASDYETAIEGISKIKIKAQEKIIKLGIENAISKKHMLLKNMHNDQEAKKMKKKLLLKQKIRKENELNDVFAASIEDEKNSIEPDFDDSSENQFNDPMVGNSIDEKDTDQSVPDDSSGSFDETV